MAKHFTLGIGDDRLHYQRDQASIHTAAALDGIYVIRIPADHLDSAPA